MVDQASLAPFPRRRRSRPTASRRPPARDEQADTVANIEYAARTVTGDWT
jgi:hypothetical protein